MFHKRLMSKNFPICDNSRQFAAKNLFLLCLIAALLLTACGELEFGVETKVSSGRPEVTVVTTTVAQIPEGMVLVTVTPSSQATAMDEATVTGTAVATQPSEAVETAVSTQLPTANSTNPPPASTRPLATPVPPQSSATPTVAWAEIPNGLIISPDAVSPGDTVTVNYSTNAASALLCAAPPMSDQWQCQSAPLAGPFDFAIDPTTRTNLNLELRAFLDGSTAYSSAVLLVFCPEDRWFFTGPPTTCPDGPPMETAAAIQRFEHGLMVWLEDGQWWVEGETIFILYDDEYQSLESIPEEGMPTGPMPDDEYSPSDGRFVPESGFGLIWRDNSWMRQRLGWALAPEVGFNTTVQREITNQGMFIYFWDDQDQLIVLSGSSAHWAERSTP
jgi:hypothetical protein